MALLLAFSLPMLELRSSKSKEKMFLLYFIVYGVLTFVPWPIFSALGDCIAYQEVFFTSCDDAITVEKL